MTMNNQLDGTSLTIAIEGRIDTQTAPQLEENIKNSIDGVTSLVLDFTQVGYISTQKQILPILLMIIIISVTIKN